MGSDSVFVSVNGSSHSGISESKLSAQKPTSPRKTPNARNQETPNIHKSPNSNFHEESIVEDIDVVDEATSQHLTITPG